MPCSQTSKLRKGELLQVVVLNALVQLPFSRDTKPCGLGAAALFSTKCNLKSILVVNKHHTAHPLRYVSLASSIILRWKAGTINMFRCKTRAKQWLITVLSLEQKRLIYVMHGHEARCAKENSGKGHVLRKATYHLLISQPIGSKTCTLEKTWPPICIRKSSTRVKYLSCDVTLGSRSQNWFAKNVGSLARPIAVCLNVDFYS